MLKPAVIAALALVALASNAEARGCVETGTIMQPICQNNDFLAGIRSIRVTMHRGRHPTNPRTRQPRQIASQIMIYKGPGDVIAHPAGCPHSAFCGCGAAVRVFGQPIRGLWLAANWFKFPRAAPTAGMVAVRRHHVFVLEQALGGDTWLAYDANSGGHATRLHARSIAGYQIVNPHAG
jgi:hypothetical protein